MSAKTPEQKAGLKRRFAEILNSLREEEKCSYPLAALNDLLTDLRRGEFKDAVGDADLHGLSSFLQNYVAAMVEQAAHQKNVRPPIWVHKIEPLTEPWFGTDLQSLRPHLLRSSPVPFKRRNLFVDSAVGDRV
jgi:hypothetical protein